MSRVLPGEADAAVDLYRLGSDARKKASEQKTLAIAAVAGRSG